MKINRRDIGYIGEAYVLYKLALMGIKAIKLSVDHDYDFLTERDIRIEVKTARPTKSKKFQKGKWYEWTVWSFQNNKMKVKYIKDGMVKFTPIRRNRKCDFFILVCLNKDSTPLKEYIVPKEVMGTTKSICIRDEESRKCPNKSKWDKYRDKWDLIKKLH